MPITKDTLRRKLKVRRDKEIALFFGISPAAVSLWKEGEPIPEARQNQAKVLRPDLFMTRELKEMAANEGKP